MIQTVSQHKERSWNDVSSIEDQRFADEDESRSSGPIIIAQLQPKRIASNCFRDNVYKWMDERCFRPLLCTVEAELGRGQPGLMGWIWDETLPQSSIDRSTFYSAAHRATKWASGRPHNVYKTKQILQNE